MRRPLTRWLIALAIAGLAMSLLLAHAAAAQQATGPWHGALPLPGGASLRIGVQLGRAPDGTLQGGFTSPDQSQAVIPLQDVRQEGAKLVFKAPRSGAAYEGDWDAARSAWRGRWTQAGVSVPLTLERGAPAALVRPQTPKPPFPYRAEEVTVDSAPGVRLAGTLTVPDGKGPFPAVVLITGSGSEDRDETVFGHKPFWVLADHLSRRGIAVLRLDDRGVAKSTGDAATATGADEAIDIEAAARYLRSRSEVDAGKVGLVGHSEGGIVAPMVAAADPKIAFLVLLAGASVPGGELLAAQRAAIGRLAGMSPEALARTESANQRIFATLEGATTTEEAARRIKAAFPQMPAERAAFVAAQATSPAMRWLVAHDPRPTLRALRLPVLALNGSKDVQVVASVNLPAFRDALKDDPGATVVELPGLNHLFQAAPTGALEEYRTIEETIDPLALNTISDWILAQTRR